jgi:hypothetical protein
MNAKQKSAKEKIEALRAEIKKIQTAENDKYREAYSWFIGKCYKLPHEYFFKITGIHSASEHEVTVDNVCVFFDETKKSYQINTTDWDSFQIDHYDFIKIPNIEFDNLLEKAVKQLIMDN